MISAVVLTKNEEKNIGECFETLGWCDEIIVVDDYSSDQTIDQIKNFAQVTPVKVRIFERHLDGDFAGQRNYGLEKAAGDWVLFVDADERITPELSEEITQKIGIPKNCAGFYIKRKDFIFGKWLNHGETGNIKLLRLAKKKAGEWQRLVHEVWQIGGKAGELQNPLLHYPHQTVREFLEDINFYTSLNAKAFYDEGLKVSAWQIIVYPAAKFLKNYFWRLGFLDGTSGFLIAVFMSFHSFLTRAKLYLLACHSGLSRIRSPGLTKI